MNGQYDNLSDKEEQIASKIVNAAFIVHKKLGSGLLESVYELCFCHELHKAGLLIKRQQPFPIVYDEMVFDIGFRLDVLVNDLVICELKSVDVMHPVYYSQLLSYLRLTQKRLGFLINFNVSTIREGIKRIVL